MSQVPQRRERWGRSPLDYRRACESWPFRRKGAIKLGRRPTLSIHRGQVTIAEAWIFRPRHREETRDPEFVGLQTPCRDSEAGSQHNLPARGRANEERFGINLGSPDPPVFGVANDLKKVRFLARIQRNRSDTPWFPPASKQPHRRTRGFGGGLKRTGQESPEDCPACRREARLGQARGACVARWQRSLRYGCQRSLLPPRRVAQAPWRCCLSRAST